MSLLLFDNFTQARRMYNVAEFCFTVSLKFIALILSVPWLLLLFLSNLSNHCATKKKHGEYFKAFLRPGHGGYVIKAGKHQRWEQI